MSDAGEAAGYRSVRTLRAEHEALLETLIAARQATGCRWAAGNRRHGNGLTAEVAVHHLDHRMTEMRRLVGSR